ncbi:DUF7696 family protein [Crenobacter cavernae]|uniref:DUF7696 family protein n=1 Tax=Crenobacter cavernae TaxID=2290923 RepID=UPI0011C05C5A|nr:hypothetical protein [Crenobacter cavernae]
MSACNRCRHSVLRLSPGSNGLLELICEQHGGLANDTCAAFSPRTAPLQDPRGESYGEAHRARCEARSVCRMLLNGRKDEYLAGVRRIRGADAAKTLEEAARGEWRRRREWMTPDELEWCRYVGKGR